MRFLFVVFLPGLLGYALWILFGQPGQILEIPGPVHGLYIDDAGKFAVSRVGSRESEPFDRSHIIAQGRLTLVPAEHGLSEPKRPFLKVEVSSSSARTSNHTLAIWERVRRDFSDPDDVRIVSEAFGKMVEVLKTSTFKFGRRHFFAPQDSWPFRYPTDRIGIDIIDRLRADFVSVLRTLHEKGSAIRDWIYPPRFPKYGALVVPPDLTPSQKARVTRLVESVTGFDYVAAADLHQCLRELQGPCSSQYGMEDYPSLVVSGNNAPFMISYYPSDMRHGGKGLYYCEQAYSKVDLTPVPDGWGKGATITTESLQDLVISFTKDTRNHALEEVIVIVDSEGLSGASALNDADGRTVELKTVPHVRVVPVEDIVTRAPVIASPDLNDRGIRIGENFIRWFRRFKRPFLVVHVRNASSPSTVANHPHPRKLEDLSVFLEPSGMASTQHAITRRLAPGTADAIVDFYHLPSSRSKREYSRDVFKDGSWTTRPDVRLSAESEEEERDVLAELKMMGSIRLEGLSKERGGELVVWFDGTRTHVLDTVTRSRQWQVIDIPTWYTEGDYDG